jgi:hypothetical protein
LQNREARIKTLRETSDKISFKIGRALYSEKIFLKKKTSAKVGKR